MVICLERDADLRMAQLMPLLLTVSCFSKIQIGFTFLVLTYLGSPGKRAVKWVYVTVLFNLQTCKEHQNNIEDQSAKIITAMYCSVLGDEVTCFS